MPELTPQYKLIITFGVDGHQIKADTLLSTLQDLKNIVGDIAYIYDNISIEGLVIEPFEAGSFKVIIKFWHEVVLTLAVHLVLNAANEHLPNPLQEPQETRTTVSRNSDGDMTIQDHDTTYTIPYDKIERFKNIRTDKSINGQTKEFFGKLNSDETIRYISFETDNTSVKTIPRQNFLNANSNREIIEFPPIYYNSAEVIILGKSGYAGNYNFDLSWKGHVFKASIFNSQIETGLNANRFRQGDTLKVVLKEVKSNDFYSNDPIYSEFSIVKVLEHIPKH